ncbi:mycofactocin precursor MftA [Catenulispora sp. EB89]
MNETDSVQTGQDTADATSPDAVDEADVLLFEGDALVEEVSIDGMCGVY